MAQNMSMVLLLLMAASGPQSANSGATTQCPAALPQGGSNAWTIPRECLQAVLTEQAQRLRTQPLPNISALPEQLPIRPVVPPTVSPEMAAFMAKQQAQAANDRATLAAVNAGSAMGRNEGRQQSFNDEMKMVKSAVQTWKAPQGYAAASSLGRPVLQNPFAPPPAAGAPTDLSNALNGTGLTWNDDHHVARVETASAVCGGRLQKGDYPTLPDGSLLDTPARIAAFVSSCGDRSSRILVLTESGQQVVRN
jgi:hypothetical protein